MLALTRGDLSLAGVIGPRLILRIMDPNDIALTRWISQHSDALAARFWHFSPHGGTVMSLL